MDILGFGIAHNLKVRLYRGELSIRGRAGRIIEDDDGDVRVDVDDPLTAADLEVVKMQGAKDFLAGTHAVIICKAKFSRVSGRFGFELIKKTPESEYLYEAYRFEAQ